ncbi:MAG: phosphate-starvation-inducible PsiE family protein [Firmicutes bacterium]|nr:phosphate-starvation-inducible PsiE family protein [Bacillota bacterium]
MQMLHLNSLRSTITRLVEWGAGGLYLLTMLFVLVVAALLAKDLILHLLRATSYASLVSLLNPLLTIMMLAELLHTIALAIRTHHLPLRPLLALVFIAILRHAVVMASTTRLDTRDALATLIGLVVLSILMVKMPAQDAD